MAAEVLRSADAEVDDVAADRQLHGTVGRAGAAVDVIRGGVAALEAVDRGEPTLVDGGHTDATVVGRRRWWGRRRLRSHRRGCGRHCVRMTQYRGPENEADQDKEHDDASTCDAHLPRLESSSHLGERANSVVCRRSRRRRPRGGCASSRSVLARFDSCATGCAEPHITGDFGAARSAEAVATASRFGA